jgi:hypothetical protein
MWFGFMVFSATFINMSVISWRSVLNDLWIGMRYDIASTPHVYRWINGEIPTFMNWKNDEPNYQLIDLCIRIAKDYNFQLRTTGCTKVLDYLCTVMSLFYFVPRVCLTILIHVCFSFFLSISSYFTVSIFYCQTNCTGRTIQTMCLLF